MKTCILSNKTSFFIMTVFYYVLSKSLKDKFLQSYTSIIQKSMFYALVFNDNFGLILLLLTE